MRRHLVGWGVTAAASLLLFMPAAHPIPAAAVTNSAFSFQWALTPAAPSVWDGNGFADTWDVLVHRRGVGEANTPVLGGHGADCSAPPATHLISNIANSVYICKNHMMTAMADNGYGATVLTPDRMVDFSSGESVISYSVSTLHLNPRTWYDIWITPFAQNLVAPLNDSVDFQGPPRTAIRIRMCECGTPTGGNDVFEASVVNNFVETKLAGVTGTPLQALVPPSAVSRTRFELHLSAGHIKFGVPSAGLWWYDNNFTAPFTQGVVQLMTHAYDPCKDQPVATTPCVYDTWHWSDFGISQSVPFTIINGAPRFVNGSQTTVNFGAPAPANAFLRFEAVSGGLQVSYDGGHTFQTPQQPAFIGDHGAIHDDHFSPYFTPIPAGTRSVVFAGKNWWGGQWEARDPSIWMASGISPVVQPPAQNPPANPPTNPPTNPATNPPTNHPGGGSGGGGTGEGSGTGGSGNSGSGEGNPAPTQTAQNLLTKMVAAVNPTNDPAINLILLLLAAGFVFVVARIVRSA